MILKKGVFSLLLLGIPFTGIADFSPEEYTVWKERVNAISKNAYAQLLECEQDYTAQMGTDNHPIPCMIKDDGCETDVVLPLKESNGYPVLVLPSFSTYCNNFRFEPLLNYYSSIKRIPPITRREIAYVLSVIKKLYPELYEELNQIDPDGLRHVTRLYEQGTAIKVTVSNEDYLPIFLVTPEFVQKMSLKKQRIALSQELDRSMNAMRGKRVAKKFPFQQTFKLAFTRDQEYEADRFAVVDLPFVIDIDDAIAAVEEGSDVSSMEFEQTHPFIQKRINQLNELRREVELGRNKPRNPIDWQKIASDYSDAMDTCP